MIDMTEDRDDRRTLGQCPGVFLINDLTPERDFSIIFFDFLFFQFFRNCLISDLTCDDGGGIKVDRPIDVGHHTVHHQDLDDLDTCCSKQFRKVSNSDRNRNFNCFCSTHIVRFHSFQIIFSVLHSSGSSGFQK